MDTDIGLQFFVAVLSPLNLNGLDFKGSAQEIRQYSAESMARLATLVGQPGFETAVEAERDIVAIKIGMRIAKDADKADMKALGVIEGALRMGAGMLSGGAV